MFPVPFLEATSVNSFLSKVEFLSLDSAELGLDVAEAQLRREGRGTSLCVCLLGHLIQKKRPSHFPDITPDS